MIQVYILILVYRQITCQNVEIPWAPKAATAPGTLLFASPFTATAPNGTVIWIMSTIGAQIGMVLVSNVQNGISCPMLAAW